MTYLTCTKHRSYQRKHTDVCRQCPDVDSCDAFQAYLATEPPPPPEPAKTNLPIRWILKELADIRELAADTPAPPATGRATHREVCLQEIEWVDFVRFELEEIRKLC